MAAVPCKYRIGPTLGSGTYAVVRECVHIETGAYFACKVISKRLMKGHEKMIVNEIRVMEQLSKGHPNIVTLQDYFETANSLYIITDLCRGGELFDRICKKKFFCERDAAKLVRSIVGAVEYLHSKGVVHRDIKPENLLFATEEDDSELLVADFGLSKMVDENTYSTLSTTCGTPAYMAPEIFRRQGYGKPVDMWAIGVTAYFLLCGYTPFDKDSQAEEIEAVCAANYSFTPERFWADVGDEARDFINSILLIDPFARLTASQALQHPWLAPVVSPSASVTPTGTPTPDLLPTFKQHADPRMKLKRSLLAVKAVGDFKDEGVKRKTRREMWGTEERKVVEDVERAQKEAEEEAGGLEFVNEKPEQYSS